MVSESLLRAAWKLPLGLNRPRPVVTLLYHGVPTAGAVSLSAEVFSRHVTFLRQHFEFVAPDDGVSGRRAVRPKIVLTFDDGFLNNAEVVAPILRRHGIPALFFVCSRHSTPGKYLWFAYLHALEKSFSGNGFTFRNSFYDMSSRSRQQSMTRLRRVLLELRPHPAAMYDAIERELPPLEEFVATRELAECYAGMTAEHVRHLASDSLFSIGVHTSDHPFLTLCDRSEARRQIESNRAWLEAAAGCRCNSIVYPAGAYSPEILQWCGDAGFSRGYTVTSRGYGRSEFEVSRIGIYSNSTDVLGFKVMWGPLLRSAHVPIG